MTDFETAKALARSGHFCDALACLEPCRRLRDQQSAEVLRAELLNLVGRSQESRQVVARLQRQRLALTEQSGCERTLALIESSTANDVRKAIAHLQRAIALADSAGDLVELCWNQLHLLLVAADHGGVLFLAPVLTSLRANAIKLGDSIVSAALHIFVGNNDGKRGLLLSANGHVTRGLRLLDIEDNTWLRAVAGHIKSSTLILNSDPEEAIRVGETSLLLAEESGSARTQQGVLGNLGFAYYLTGDFNSAVSYLAKAIDVVASTGERANAGLDSLASVYVSQGQLSEAFAQFRRIEGSIKTDSDWSLHAHRHALLNLASLLERTGRYEEALEKVGVVLEISERTDDRLLYLAALVTKAGILGDLNRDAELRQIVVTLANQLSTAPHELFAHYERFLACALASTGGADSGREHYDRARRIYKGLRNVPGVMEVERLWREDNCDAEIASSESSHQVASNLLQNVAALMLHAGRPELLATGLVAIVADTGSVTAASAVSRADDGTTEILASFSDAAASRGGEPERTLAIGRARNRFVEVVLQPRDDLESLATLNALTLLLGTVRDLEQAHAEREERLALWPLEELPVDDEHAIVNGRMRELMTFARRVAMTTVSVLITGESGTGKEILARAIHGYSPRAQKLFIPFNCTAIPRDMLESQLFGHRRGAFTSADRDNPGLIRAAKEGTLFLDEIGELGLDLQPKLLRFLESGEICPLGESIPLTVDVRIVAATNRNLEDLVREGRFREDLFYRLNVIRLTIPPLRERRDEIPPLVYHFVMQAGAEFGKGHIRVAEETMEHLLLYSWPGNIRQLHNEIRRMVALADVDAVLKPSALSADIRRAAAKASPRTAGQVTVSLDEKLMPAISKIERELIRTALRAHDGQLEEAARALGISRKGLYLKRQRLGL